jgi:hypothetical protein
VNWRACRDFGRETPHTAKELDIGKLRGRYVNCDVRGERGEKEDVTGETVTSRSSGPRKGSEREVNLIESPHCTIHYMSTSG